MRFLGSEVVGGSHPPFIFSGSNKKLKKPKTRRPVFESQPIFAHVKKKTKDITSVTNKYFSNPYLINAAKNAIELLESKEDVWCRNAVIENQMSVIVNELRNAVIDTDSEKSVERVQ